MSVLTTLPAPIVQMALVEKIVDEQQNQPHVQQLVSQVTTRQELRARRGKVSALDFSEEMSRIQEGDEEPNLPDKGSRRPKTLSPHDDVPEEPEQEQPRTKPWAGHILNIRI
jgi:hypothetical protein